MAAVAASGAALAALLIIAFRGVTAIVFSHSSASPAVGTGSASAKTGQFPVARAGAHAAEFGRVYLNFNLQDQGLREQNCRSKSGRSPSTTWSCSAARWRLRLSGSARRCPWSGGW
jgi:hypothetical protein